MWVGLTAQQSIQTNEHNTSPVWITPVWWRAIRISISRTSETVWIRWAKWVSAIRWHVIRWGQARRTPVCECRCWVHKHIAACL